MGPEESVEKKGLRGYAFGHAGSGNLHMEILGNPEDKAQWQKVREAEEEIVHFALECGGRLTGSMESESERKSL